MKKKIIILNDNNFQDFILKNKFILVDFWAEWCFTCQRMYQILVEINEEFHNNLIIAKINVDNNTIITEKYNIRSIPTLLLFENSKLIEKIIGIFTKEKLKNLIIKKIYNNH